MNKDLYIYTLLAVLSHNCSLIFHDEHTLTLVRHATKHQHKGYWNLDFRTFINLKRVDSLSELQNQKAEALDFQLSLFASLHSR